MDIRNRYARRSFGRFGSVLLTYREDVLLGLDFEDDLPMDVIRPDDDTSVVSIREWIELQMPHRQADELPRAVFRQLEEYFARKRKKFDIPYRFEGTDFQQCVWRELEKIPYGEVVTYGEIAASVGRPRAIRATGTAVSKNPLAILVPCHRVIPKAGGVGEYAFGQKLKFQLLCLENAPIDVEGYVRKGIIPWEF